MVIEFGPSVDIGGIGYMKNPPVFTELARRAPKHPFVFIDIQETRPERYPQNISVLKPTTQHWEGLMRYFLAKYKIPLPDSSANDVRMDFVMDFLHGRQTPALMREVGRILRPESSFYMVDFSANCLRAQCVAHSCGLRLVSSLGQEQLLASGYPLSPNTESFIELNLDGTIPFTTELNIFAKK